MHGKEDILASDVVVFGINQRVPFGGVLGDADNSGTLCGGAFSDILSERFGKVLLGKSGELAINLSATAQYAEGDDKVVDYIIVIVSEENLDTAFSLAVK